MRFDPPPGWPAPPAGFVPPPGWQPDPSWPPPPPGWRLWVDDQPIPARDAQPWSAALPPDHEPGARPFDQGPGPYDPAAGYSHGLPWHPATAYDAAEQPPVKVKVSRWAIASLVSGLLSIVVVSVFCSIVALVRIKMFGEQRGRGLAIGGLAVSGTWILVGILILVHIHLSQATRSPSGEITHGGQLSVLSLSVGDCFSYTPGAKDVHSVPAVPCNQAHNAQVFAKFNLSGYDAYSGPISYPGDAAVTRLGADGCNLRLGALDKSKITDSMTIYYLSPKQQNWLDGNLAVTCWIVDTTANVTSSVLK
jgi:Septum formation